MSLALEDIEPADRRKDLELWTLLIPVPIIKETNGSLDTRKTLIQTLLVRRFVTPLKKDCNLMSGIIPFS